MATEIVLYIALILSEFWKSHWLYDTVKEWSHTHEDFQQVYVGLLIIARKCTRKPLHTARAVSLHPSWCQAKMS